MCGPSGGANWFHLGDIVWRLFQNTTIVPEETVRLVRGVAGDLAAIIWLCPPAGVDLFVLSDAPRFEALTAFAMCEAEAMLQPGHRPFSCEAPSHQAALGAVLADCGYSPSGDRLYVCNVQSLVGLALPAPSRTVRPMNANSDRELDARVALHRVVWKPSKFTREGYDRLRTKPVYRADLDIVAVTPKGELAAYAIVWWDPVTRTGEFEPVGADPRFRRQGYASSVMFEGLRRLQALGTTRAVVLSAADPEGAPANALYRTAGFAPRFSLVEWTKPSAQGSGQDPTTPEA